MGSSLRVRNDFLGWSPPVKDRVVSASSSDSPPPLSLLSLSQTSSHSPLPDPGTAASVWVAIWLTLCLATEVVPLHCAHVLIAVNNFCYYHCGLQVTVVIGKRRTVSLPGFFRHAPS